MALGGFKRQLAEVDSEVLGEIARRREAPDLTKREDVLSLLLQARDEEGRPLSDGELRDELVTLLVAGHETTAAALAWALDELADAPAVQERLAAGEEGLAEAVVSETLRLHPPVPLGALRRLRKPLRIGGHDLPAGATVAACALLVHRRADLYEHPDTSCPIDFLAQSRRPEPGCRLAAAFAAASARHSHSSRPAWSWKSWQAVFASRIHPAAGRSALGGAESCWCRGAVVASWLRNADGKCERGGVRRTVHLARLCQGG